MNTAVSSYPFVLIDFIKNKEAKNDRKINLAALESNLDMIEYLPKLTDNYDLMFDLFMMCPIIMDLKQ
jgi:hypothetical protein